MYGNWIKILGLNQVRKEKEKQRRQHLEDVRTQREGEKATTEDEEETRVPEEKSSTIELREEKLSGGRKGETQPSKVVKQRKNKDKSSNQEKVSNKPNTSNRNSQELATATQVEKKKDDDIGAKKSIPQNKRFVLRRKKLDSTMKMDYIKAVLKEKRLDILFLQETEIPDGCNMSLLNIPGCKLECELTSLGNKIRLEEKTAISTEKFMMNGLRPSQLLI